jgi:hypothetical protein
LEEVPFFSKYHFNVEDCQSLWLYHNSQRSISGFEWGGLDSFKQSSCLPCSEEHRVETRFASLASRLIAALQEASYFLELDFPKLILVQKAESWRALCCIDVKLLLIGKVMLGIWMDTCLQSYGGGGPFAICFFLCGSSSCSAFVQMLGTTLLYNKFADGRKHLPLCS